MPALRNSAFAKTTIQWLEKEKLWPNGKRQLFADAYGLCLLVSLHSETGEAKYLTTARWLVAEVQRVLGRKKGLVSSEDSEHNSQDYYNLVIWIYALSQLGKHEPVYRAQAIKLAKDIHPFFCVPTRGVVWRMAEDLTGPFVGFYGYSSIDAFYGYAVYRQLNCAGLQNEICDLKKIMDRAGNDVYVPEELTAGRLLWSCILCAREPWARSLIPHILRQLDEHWVEAGYFARTSRRCDRIAFTNYCVSISLQACIKTSDDFDKLGAAEIGQPLLLKEERDKWMSRVQSLNFFFDTHDEADHDPITVINAACSQFPGCLIR